MPRPPAGWSSRRPTNWACRLTAEIARPAFVALATDTGWFRFSSTTAGTLRLAARLVDAGAAPDQLYKELYETDTHGRLRLIGTALAHTQTELGGRLIYTWLSQSDFAACGAVPSDSEDIINMTLAVGGTEAAVILVEQRGGGYQGESAKPLPTGLQRDCRAVRRRRAQEGRRGDVERAAGIRPPENPRRRPRGNETMTFSGRRHDGP